MAEVHTGEKVSRLRLNRLWHDRFTPYFLVIFIFWMVCLVESIQEIGGQTLNPRFWIFLSVLITLYGGFKIFRLHSVRVNVPAPPPPTGMEEVLTRIQSQGFFAYADESANRQASHGPGTQHVVVGPGGVYVIETKAGKVFGSRTVDYRSENELILGGKITDNRPLKRVRTTAESVRADLKESLQHHYPVKPLVVFLGDWKVNQPLMDLNVAVMGVNDFESYLNRQQPILSGDEISRVRTHLESSSARPAS